MASEVTMAVTTLPPPISTRTLAITGPDLIETTLPLKMLRALSFMMLMPFRRDERRVAMQALGHIPSRCGNRR